MGILMFLLVLTPVSYAKVIIGIYEQVALPTKGLVLKAKIDSGAKNTSLHAVNIKLFKQNDKDWVSFDTINGKGETLSLSAPIYRIARIKRHSGVSQERPVKLRHQAIGKNPTLTLRNFP